MAEVTAIETVYVARRKMKGPAPDGEVKEYLPGDAVPGVQLWPTFKELVRLEWVLREEDYKQNEAAVTARLKRRIARSQGIRQEVDAPESASESDAAESKEPAKDKAPDGKLPDPGELSVTELLDAAGKLKSKDELLAVLSAEKAGKARATAIGGIEALLEDVSE